MTTNRIDRRLRANEISLTPIGSQFFSVHNRDELVAEASDLGPMRDGTWWLQRLFNDAADVGIAILSKRTGITVRFVLEEVRKDNEGDLLAWHFVPLDTREAGRANGIKRITILND